ncbi:hypothetical protein D3C79_916250 [compost metagenome]
MLPGEGMVIIADHQPAGVAPAFLSGPQHCLAAGQGQVLGNVALVVDNPADHRHRQRGIAARFDRQPVAVVVGQHRGQRQSG